MHHTYSFTLLILPLLHPLTHPLPPNTSLVGCSKLCFARSYTLTITYWQVNQTAKQLVAITLAGDPPGLSYYILPPSPVYIYQSNWWLSPSQVTPLACPIIYYPLPLFLFTQTTGGYYPPGGPPGLSYYILPPSPVFIYPNNWWLLPSRWPLSKPTPYPISLYTPLPTYLPPTLTSQSLTLSLLHQSLTPISHPPIPYPLPSYPCQATCTT